MAVRIKQDRSRKGGHIHSRSAQDAPVIIPAIVQDAIKQATGRKSKRVQVEIKPIDSTANTLGNLRTARNILRSNLTTFGDRLPVKLRAQLAVVLANMNAITQDD